jgi:hypothetical protein
MNPKTTKRMRLNKETVRGLTSGALSRAQLLRAAAAAPTQTDTFYCSNWVSCTWITCGTSDYGNTVCPESEGCL